MERAQFIREDDVRQVIERSSYTTTLRELERRGRHQVRVVRASEISRLIAEAVDRVVSQASVSLAEEERDMLVRQSQAQLEVILRERRGDDDKFRDQQRRVERHLRRELDGCLQRIAELKQANEDLRRQQIHMSPATVVTSPLPSPSSPAPAPAVPPEFVDGMLARMNELRESMEELRRARTEEASASSETNETLKQQEAMFAERFQQTFDEAIARFSAHFDKKLQESDENKAHQHVEAAEVVLDSLFEGLGEKALESNIENVAVKKTTGAGISANVERLKSLSPRSKKPRGKNPRA